MNIFGKVIEFCSKNLLQNQEAFEYVNTKRKISKESIDKFEIGLFPQDLRELFEVVSPKDLRELGIIKNASISTFKIHNLVLPIKDVYGNYIALAGRTMMDEEERKAKNIVKYMNTVYKKSQHLFNLNLAKNKIIAENVVYVAEGYFDVITPYQNGLENIVATCGAFLSNRHTSLLSRYTNNIILILDNEFEAQEKAKKAVEKNKYDGINLLQLNPLKDDEEKDLDDFLKTHNLKELKERLEVKDINKINPLWD